MLAWLPTYFTDTMNLTISQAAQFSLLPPMAALAASAVAGPLADSLIAKDWDVGVVRKTAQCVAFLGPVACLGGASLTQNSYMPLGMAPGGRLLMLWRSLVLGSYMPLGPAKVVSSCSSAAAGQPHAWLLLSQRTAQGMHAAAAQHRPAQQHMSASKHAQHGSSWHAGLQRSSPWLWGWEAGLWPACTATMPICRLGTPPSCWA